MSTENLEKTVLQCLEENYRLTGKLQRLPGENLNYLLTTKMGARWIAKIVGDDMPPEVVKMEFAAMEHAISAGFTLCLPKIHENINGNIETGIIIRKKELKRLRLLIYIDYKLLENKSDISIKLTKNVGKSLALFHFAMRRFNHPAAHRNHRWNLAEAGQHRDKIGWLNDPLQRDLMTWGFDSWEAVKSALESLRWQFIHGDMNRENILVSGERVAGLVDFGDACFNPAVCDLAICLAYLMMDSEDPLQRMSAVLAGYREILPLSDAETRVLLPLVAGRLVTSIAVSTERKRIDPDNPYWFGDEDAAWSLLKFLRQRANGRPLSDSGM